MTVKVKDKWLLKYESIMISEIKPWSYRSWRFGVPKDKCENTQQAGRRAAGRVLLELSTIFQNIWRRGLFEYCESFHVISLTRLLPSWEEWYGPVLSLISLPRNSTRNREKYLSTFREIMYHHRQQQQPGFSTTTNRITILQHPRVAAVAVRARMFWTSLGKTKTLHIKCCKITLTGQK